MEIGIAEGFAEESLEAKLQWFLTKTPNERMRDALEWLAFTDKLRQTEPPDDDRSTFTTVQILERPRG